MHEKLWQVVRRLDTDYEPHGKAERDGSDCSWGRRHFIKLAGDLGDDWGVCSNSRRSWAPELLNETEPWKMNRYVVVDKDRLQRIDALRRLKTGEHRQARSVLEELLDAHGVDLLMASTILRFRKQHPRIAPKKVVAKNVAVTAPAKATKKAVKKTATEKPQNARVEGSRTDCGGGSCHSAGLTPGSLADRSPNQKVYPGSLELRFKATSVCAQNRRRPDDHPLADLS
jgi:hypothetical protein